MARLTAFECVADFPDDMVEEDDEIVIPGGRLVAEAVANLLRSAGMDVSGPELDFEHGWEAHVSIGKGNYWVLVTDLADTKIIQTDDLTPLWHRFGAGQAAYRAFVKTLHDLVSVDPRFTNVEWMKPSPWAIGS